MKTFVPGTLILLLLAGWGCQQKPVQKRKTGLLAMQGMVVSAHPEASAIGKQILSEGGNAVDAACAVQFALAVSYPVAGNIGGGGFMVIRLNNGEVATLDYREKAPLLAGRDMYLDKNGEVVPGLSTLSPLAAGVPGAVDGMVIAHKKFGKLDFTSIIQPSIDIARTGFPVTEKQAGRLNRAKEVFLKWNRQPISFVKNEDWKKGDTLRQLELAHTLELIRDHGRAGFYEGETANRIVEQMAHDTGLISQKDLDAYHSVWRAPVTGNYRGYKVISMAPPSSGGVAILQIFKMIEPYPLSSWGWNSIRTVHLVVEAEKRAYADRAEFLGDPGYYDVPQNGLLNQDYLKSRMSGFSMEKATPSEQIRHGDPLPYESKETTHFSVVDAEGNAVAVTTTLNRGFGNRIVVSGAGFLLNDEMDDFSSKPGVPNSFGLVGGEANSIQPGKRMLSSMTPTILEKDHQLFMVVGSPGGSTIITSVLQTIMNVVDHGMSMQDAVDAGRYHHQWLPDYISYEKDALDENTITELKKMGHHLKTRSSIGRVDAILKREDGTLEGGADPRGDDTAEGVEIIE